MNYSVSFTVGGPAQADDNLDELIIRDGLQFHRLAGDEFLAINRFTLRSSAINRNVWPVLDQLDRFRSLPEHRQKIRESLPDFPASDEELTAVLAHLRAHGLLISAREFLDRLAGADAATTEGATAAPWALSITTCDRPRLLTRLLTSSTRYLREMRPRPRLLLIDDSRDSDNARANQRSFLDWCRSHRIEGEYWGKAARLRLAQTLIRHMPAAADVIEWLLSPLRFPGTPTYGQPQNTGRLLNAGMKELLLDDDCYLEPRIHSCNRSGLQLHDDPQDVYLYDSPEALWSVTRILDVNPFHSHLDMLGRHLPEAFANLNLPYRDAGWLRQLPAGTLARMSGDARIRISINTTIGDPGTGSMDWLYTRTGESLNRVARFIAGKSRDEPLPRLVWKGYRSHLVTMDEALMTTTLTGVDNRHLIPCVFPTARGQDLELGDGARFVDPAACFFIFNWGLPHLPEPARQWCRRNLLPSGQPPEIQNSLDAILYHYRSDCTLTDPQARLHHLADLYEDLANRPADRLVNDLARIKLQHDAGWLKNFSAAKNAGGAFGPTWQEDIDTLISRTASRIQEPLRPSPAWLEAFRGQARYYARALRIWPALRDYVSEHRDRLRGD